MREAAKNMPDDLDDVARQLRQGAGEDLRAEAAADEELTELQRRRRMDLSEAARAALHRGDRVTARAGGLTLSHPLVAVGDDYVTMESDDRWIDIRLGEAVLTIVSRSAGGRSGRPSSATLRARMAELEQEGADVELIDRNGGRWAGRLEVMGADHALLASEGGYIYVPLDCVAVAFSRFPPRRS